MRGILGISSKRNGKIELYRFVFALLIMTMHSSTFVTNDVKNFFHRGAICTEYFFLVSGYFLACSVSKLQLEQTVALGRETQLFILRKIKALMPNYIIAWLIGFVVTMISYLEVTPKAWLKKAMDTIWEVLFLEMYGFGRVRVNGVTWYISAMLLWMVILYPLCRKYFDMMTRVITPSIAAFILGYLYYNCGTTVGVTSYMQIAYRGTIRALAVLSLGIASYPLIIYLQKLDLSMIGKALTSVLEIGAFIFVIAYTWFSDSSNYDFFAILLLVVGTILALSQQGLFARIFDNKFCMLLGKFSLSLYLGHVYWGRLLHRWFPQGSYLKLLCVYFALALCTAIFIFSFSEFLKKKKGIITLALRTVFLNVREKE